MQEYEQLRTQHDPAGLELAPAFEPEPAVERQPAAQVVPEVASFARLTGQTEVEAEGPRPVQQQAQEQQQQATIISGDPLVEQLAHGMVAKELDDKDEAFLAANGYRALPIIRGKHEFVMRTFLPTQAGKSPIVSFRGTVPSKVDTLIADVDPRGIGVYQFKPNKSLIEGQMQAAAEHGKVISAGHSLGGALAQLAAANFPDLVDRIVTFQAPGVSNKTAQKVSDYNDQHPEDEIESTHYRVKNDLVPLGGQALTEGTIHNYKMTGGSKLSRNPLAAHLEFPLAQEQYAQGVELPVQTEQGMEYVGQTTTEQDKEDKTQGVEYARKGIGGVIFGAGWVGHRIGDLARGVGDLITSPFRDDEQERERE